jgi:hypothetical protein
VTDLVFIVAGYGVILGTVAVYAVTLARRLVRARAASLRVRDEAEQAPIPDDRRA